MRKHRDRNLEKTLQETLNSGGLVWVLGDVHGHFSTLETLISKLGLLENDKLVSLGDLIDRGPNSAAVLRLFRDNPIFHFIRGNHEDLMLKCLFRGKNKDCKSWLKYGGLETLESFGLNPESKETLADDWCDFLSNSPSEIFLEKHRLVHAGINPLRSLDEQTENDRLWSRNIFEFNTAPDPKRQKFVGHTPTQEIDEHRSAQPWYSGFTTQDDRPAIIALDTGVSLEKARQPTLTAMCINSGKVVQVKRGFSD